MNAIARTFPVIPEMVKLARAIQAAGGRPLLVGGWVRDCLLGHPHSKDFDVEVFGIDPRTLHKVLQRFGPVHEVGRHFGVLKVATASAEYDVSVPRRESKTGKGHKGFWVATDPHMTFADAAARRDFTLNSMGYALLDEEFLDPFGGEQDLRLRVLRHVGTSFGEDPLRVLRAMQFAGRFGLSIAEETLAICRTQDLHELPRERMWEEFRKLLLRSPKPSVGLAYAPELGVLPYFPELEALYRAASGAGQPAPWQRMLAVLDAAAALRPAHDEDALVFMLAALGHSLGRSAGHAKEGPAKDKDGARSAAALAQAAAHAAAAATERLLLRLTNEQALVERVCALVRELPLVDAAGDLRDGDLRRLSLRVPLPTLAGLATALHGARMAPGAPAGMARGGGPPAASCPAAATLRARAEALGVWTQPPEPLLKGRHLLEAGMRPGPRMGHLLRLAFERQLDGDLRTLDDAVGWMRRELNAPAATAEDAP
ncbi:MAG: CCA tRNA nucleotidyltransferase [Candidatus Lambdaproteobacteria bacterium]|nr:CCA tRNA nucleotidyltransferase [Candidatus Lambdaproteobacteria bacterium]